MSSVVLWFPQNTVVWSSAVTIRGLGIHEHMTTVVDRPTGTDDYLFMHFYTPVRVFVHGAMQDIPANTFFIWQPGDRHTFGHTTQLWDHSWIHCSGTAITASLKAINLPFASPIRLLDSTIIDRYLPAIRREIQDHTQPDLVILANHFTIWLRELLRASLPEQERYSIPDRLVHVRKFIEENSSQRISLSELAGLANLSASHFSTEFRRYFGTSPIEYILRFRMQQAMYFLRDINMPISQVAEKVGFTDAFYFSKQFKKRHGMSPMTYRKVFSQHPQHASSDHVANITQPS